MNAELRRPTCLIVDDSRVVRKVARRILEGGGFAVEEAEDGAAALAACRRRLPDGVLLDWNMPVMNGIDFLRALRAEAGPNRPIVVFCTTENELESIAEAITAGAHEYIMKPFDEDILLGKFAQVGLHPGLQADLFPGTVAETGPAPQGSAP